MKWPLYQYDPQPSLMVDSNRGLWYNRFFNRYDDDWSIPDDGKRQWVSDNAKLTGQRKALQVSERRQSALITALGGQSMVFKTDWHFASGLGLPHPVENGLIWHHTLGVPYLAGSGVKGLLRAWVEVWDELLNEHQQEKERRLIHWFGDLQHAGQFLFFDALPVEPVTLVADVMSPHMDKWYEKGGEIDNYRQQPERVPADWHAPVPVPFLVVKEAKLLFSIAPRRPKFKEELLQVFEALKQALDWLGAGAKTATGYGRMVEDSGYLSKLSKDATQAVAQTEWRDVTLQWIPGKDELSANDGPNRAFADGSEAHVLRKALNDAQYKRLKKGKLKANLTVEPAGGKHWKIIALWPLD